MFFLSTKKNLQFSTSPWKTDKYFQVSFNLLSCLYRFMIYVKSGLSFQSFISMCSYCVLWFNNQELEPVQVGLVFSGMINRNWTIPTVFILSALAKLKFHMKCFRLRQITGGWVCIQFLIKTWSILVDLHLTCQEFLQLGNCKSFCTIFYLEKKNHPFYLLCA